MPFVALRRGEAKFRGWSLRDDFSKKIMQNKSSPITGNDIRMEFTQKGVDMRIGIDVATLALKRLVDRIIIFTGDTDMVPAIKSRKNGRCASRRCSGWHMEFTERTGRRQ